MPPYAIELAMYTGMRVSELSTMQWSDIDDGCISINKSAKHDRLRNEFYVGKTKTKNDTSKLDEKQKVVRNRNAKFKSFIQAG